MVPKVTVRNQLIQEGGEGLWLSFITKKGHALTFQWHQESLSTFILHTISLWHKPWSTLSRALVKGNFTAPSGLPFLSNHLLKTRRGISFFFLFQVKFHTVLIEKNHNTHITLVFKQLKKKALIMKTWNTHTPYSVSQLGFLLLG